MESKQTREEEQTKINEQDKQNRDINAQARKDYVNRIEKVATGLKGPALELNALLNEGMKLMTPEDQEKYAGEVKQAQDALKGFNTISELLNKAKSKI